MGRTDHDGQRVVNVNAGRQIRRSICHVEHGYHAGKNVVCRHCLGTHQMNVREDDRNEDENGHSERQRRGQSVVSLFIILQEEKPEAEYIWKPEQVGDDEYRSERNHIIDTCMDHCIVEPVPVCDQGKGNQVGNHVKEHGPGQPDLVGK